MKEYRFVFYDKDGNASVTEWVSAKLVMTEQFIVFEMTCERNNVQFEIEWR